MRSRSLGKRRAQLKVRPCAVGGELTDLEQAKKYRQQAAELLLMAEKVIIKEQRHGLLTMATMYHRLAERLEAGGEDDELG